MTPAPKKFRCTRKRVDLTQTGISDNANQNLDEQVALFSKLVMENSKTSIYQVWSKLDPIAHFVIMSELGFLEGKVCAQHYEWAREDAAELKRHTRMLRTFLKKQAEHENIAARRPRSGVEKSYNSMGICYLFCHSTPRDRS